MSILRREIMKTKRDYFMNHVKKPLRLGLIEIGKRFPVPERNDCTRPNTPVLLAIREEFFNHHHNNNGGNGRDDMFDAAFRVLICVYESDPYYSQLFDWFIKQIIDSDWKFKNPHPMMRTWKE